MKKTSENLSFSFILGFERSGTTLLSQLINAHPNAISPPENLLLLQFYHQYKNKTNWTKNDIDYIVDNILWEGMKSMHLWGIDKTSLKSVLYPLTPNTSYPAVVKKIYTQFLVAKQKKDLKVIVDKNNPFTYHYEKLQNLFPNAKFIFLVRDYRGVFLSRKSKKVFYKSQDPYISGVMWKTINEKIFNTLENKLIVRYEDLVENTERELTKICQYLNISYDSAMLDYQGNLNAMLEKSQNEQTLKMMKFIGASLFKPIDKTLINKWEIELSEDEIKTLDTVCQPFANKLGYTSQYELSNFKLKKPFLNSIHFNFIFKPLMKYQFSSIFTTGLLKRFIHK